MLKTKLDFDTVFAKVRFLYLFVFAVFVTLNKFIFFQFVNASFIATVYSGLAIFGAMLLAVDFFSKRYMFKVNYNGFLVLFFVAFVLSMIVNLRYGFVDNAKTLAWMLIQVFFLMAVPTDRSATDHLKELKIIANTFTLIWFVGAVWSFLEFLVQYSAVLQIPGDNNCIEGFAVGRLFGVFTDPNVAAVCSMIAIVFSAFMLYNEKMGKVKKAYYIASIAFQAIYISLSGSRTGTLIVAAVVFMSAVLVFGLKFSARGMKRVKKVALTTLTAIMCVVFVVSSMEVTKFAMSYAPKFIEPVVSSIEDTLEIEFNEASDSEIAEKVDMTRPDVEGNEDISNARFKIWTDSLKLFEKSPIVGTSPRNHLQFTKYHYGPEMYIYKRQYSVHNGYLSLLVYTGILGAVTMMLWIGFSLVKIVGYLIRRRHSQDEYYMPIAFFSMVLVIIGISAFPMMGIFFGNSVIELIFWLIAGYTLCFIRKSEPDKNALPVTAKISDKFFGLFKKSKVSENA